MCGISGVFQKKNKDADINYNKSDEYINILINSIKLRGPNNTGKLKNNYGFLGHTRLSIRDLSTASNQPISLKRDKGNLVYNGEIYNADDLTYKYSLNQTISDTLFLKELFESNEDLNFIKSLIGDFAIAYWDKKHERLFLIRDHFGKKPIYYCKFRDYFLFNSSIKGIQDVIKSKKIDNESLSNYLVYGNMFDDKTIFEDIRQVLPGNILIWDSNTGEISNSKFFDLKSYISNNSFKDIDYKDLTNLFSSSLEKVVSSHLCSDVPISLLLSSGIDSKTIARYAFKANLFAYTAKFEGNNNEIKDSTEFANYYKELNHQIVNIDNFSVFKILEEIICFLGEPFADPSIIPLFCLYKNLPPERKVVLQGDGGDELFGGYRRYKLFEKFSKFPKNKLFKRISNLNINNHRLGRLMNLLTLEDAELYKNIMTTDYRGFNTIYFFEEFINKAGISKKDIIGNAYSRDFNNTCDLETREQLSAIDFINQLPNQFLYKVDRVSMMCGIEARIPLVDLRLLKLVTSISPDIRFKSNPSKKFFRDSVDIPKKFKSTPKRGFGTPIAIWLSSSKDYLRKMILKKSFIDFFLLDKKEMIKLININKYSAIDSYCLWKILCLSIWFHYVFEK